MNLCNPSLSNGYFNLIESNDIESYEIVNKVWFYQDIVFIYSSLYKELLSMISKQRFGNIYCYLAI